MKKNIFDYTTPTGKKGNLLSVSGWLEMVLGVFVLMLSFAWGQSLYQKVGARVPLGGDRIERVVNDANITQNQVITL